MKNHEGLAKKCFYFHKHSWDFDKLTKSWLWAKWFTNLQAWYHDLFYKYFHWEQNTEPNICFWEITLNFYRIYRTIIKFYWNN